MAVDTHGKVYAAQRRRERDPGLWRARQTRRAHIWPGRAPAPGTPTPGIIPAGYEAEIGISNTTTLSTTGNIPVDPDLLMGGFHICGLAVDPRDNLYVVEVPQTGGINLLRFDSNGNITARWPLPHDFRPAMGCLAADAEHVYVSSSFGQVYVLDLAGQVQRESLWTIDRLAWRPAGRSRWW